MACRVSVADARFGRAQSFSCASTSSTRAVVSTWSSSTSPTHSAVTRRSASRRAEFSGNYIRRGQCAEAPRSTTRPHTSPSSRTPSQLPRRSSEQSTAPASSAPTVSRLHWHSRSSLILFFSPRKRESMFLPALVCLSVCDHDN